MQTTKTPRWQNIVGLLLALCMALTLLSVQALAAPGDEAEPDTPADPIVLSPALENETVTYTGDPMPYHGAEGLEGISAAAVTYMGRDGTKYPETSAAPTNAGTYTVTAALTPDEEYLLADGLYTAVLTIEKAAQDTPAATLEDRSAHSLTVTAIPGAEYCIDGGGTWQDTSTFYDLEADTSYAILVRMKEDENHFASGMCPVAGTTTGTTVDVLGLELPAYNAVYNGTGHVYPTDQLTGLKGVKNIHVTYIGTLPNGKPYELPSPPVDAGSYTARLWLTATDGWTLTADQLDAAMTISKAAQAMTATPAIADRTTSTIALTAIPGAEYSMDGGGTWQDDPRFTGLASNTAYTFSLRMKETDNYLSSDSRTVEGRTLADTGLTYKIDFYRETIHFDPAVVEMGKDRKLAALLADGSAIEPGMTVYMRLVDGGAGEPGPIIAAELPERPEAPDVTVDLRNLTADTTRDMEYSADGGKAWAKCVSDMDVSSLIGKKFLVREAATLNRFASEAAEFAIPARGERPSVTLNTIAETVSTAVGMDFSADGGKTWKPCTGPLDVSSLTGKEILVRYSSSEAAPPSEAAKVKVPARRSAPASGHTDETRRGRNDGTLTGTAKTMEYRLTPNGKWTAISSSTVTGLAPGIYEVRYAADDANFVSQTQSVVILKGGDLPGSRLYLLDRDNHTAYITGRTSTQAAPTADITRAETATILYRLLTQEAKANYSASVSPFQDVPGNTWYSAAVATLANMDVLSIYQGGTFEPNRSITRGELAAILARFCGTAGASGGDHFTDISGSWAREAINLAAEAGLIYGYTDGTFRPDQTITRAETIAMVNRILGRSIQAGTVLSGYKTFQDVPASAWYYWDIVEASNSHSHSMDGSTEQWTAIG